MYIFAKNAAQLPDSPEDYETNVAYRKTPSADFVSNGLVSSDFVETAQLNDWLFNLTTLTEDLSTMGIASPKLFTADEWQENDLKRDEDGQTILIYKNNGFVPLLAEATTTTAGFIDISKIFKHENPFDLIPLSKHDIAGSVKSENTVLKNDFLKVTVASTVQSNGEIQDDNDIGETGYYSTGPSDIIMFPARETSKFYLKHIRCNPQNTTIHINDVGYRPIGSDVIVLSDGTMFE